MIEATDTNDEVRALRARVAQLEAKLVEVRKGARAERLTADHVVRRIERERDEARGEAEALRTRREEEAPVIRAALRLMQAERRAASASTLGPAVLAHEREVREASADLMQACADLAVCRLARALAGVEHASVPGEAGIVTAERWVR